MDYYRRYRNSGNNLHNGCGSSVNKRIASVLQTQTLDWRTALAEGFLIFVGVCARVAKSEAFGRT